MCEPRLPCTMLVTAGGCGNWPAAHSKGVCTCIMHGSPNRVVRNPQCGSGKNSNQKLTHSIMPNVSDILHTAHSPSSDDRGPACVATWPQAETTAIVAQQEAKENACRSHAGSHFSSIIRL